MKLFGISNNKINLGAVASAALWEKRVFVSAIN
jgi:hypothetical protein